MRCVVALCGDAVNLIEEDDGFVACRSFVEQPSQQFFGLADPLAEDFRA